MKNEEFNEIFRQRTMAYALAVIEFLETVPVNTATRIMSYQFGKAGTSVGANFRAFCRGRSKNERFAKICIVVEEADESLYWTTLFDKTSYGDREKLAWLAVEGLELTKISASIKDAMYPNN